jgi:uncharacterized protein (DUF305 family)
MGTFVKTEQVTHLVFCVSLCVNDTLTSKDMQLKWLEAKLPDACNSEMHQRRTWTGRRMEDGQT